MGRLFLTFSLLLSCALQAAAQFPPTPEDVKVVQSKFHAGINISYKEVYHFHFLPFSFAKLFSIATVKPCYQPRSLRYERRKLKLKYDHSPNCVRLPLVSARFLATFILRPTP